MASVKNTDPESFRDRIATVNKDGRRNWIYALQPKGRYYNARTLLSLLYLTVLFALPFLRYNGEPLFLFDILERRFILFGVVFWPQDFFIFGLGMLVFILFVVLFTVVFGRVFCGWVCPQTVFLEMVFRRLEYWIEGSANQQKQLNNGPWTTEKIRKKAIKHSLFFIISFLIANTFLAYIIGTDRLFQIMREPVSQHAGGFSAILIFTGLFYAVFSWFREQVCLIACPYGRLQGVMLDKNSVVVAYDYVRGEPRHHFKKNEERTHGDCIDCFQCVRVCPTGIDIRNGTQMECVSCTACIDACDHMMESVGLPKGLIRHDSETGIAQGKKWKPTPRMVAYSVVLLLLIGVLATLLLTRSDVDTTILRTPGMLYQEQAGGQVSNLYNIKLINKTHRDMPISLKLEEGMGSIKMVGNEISVPAANKAESSFFIYLDKKDLSERKTTLVIGVYSSDKKIETIKTSFMGPVNN